MDKKTLIHLVLHSAVLTPRQRWIVVRKIKEIDISSEELEKISQIIQKEQEFLQAAKPETNEAYEARLQTWWEQLQNLRRTDFADQNFDKECDDAIQDDIDAEELLKDLP